MTPISHKLYCLVNNKTFNPIHVFLIFTLSVINPMFRRGNPVITHLFSTIKALTGKGFAVFIQIILIPTKYESYIR